MVQNGNMSLSIGFFENFSITAEEDTENGRIVVTVYDKRTGDFLVEATAVVTPKHDPEKDSWIDDLSSSSS